MRRVLGEVFLMPKVLFLVIFGDLQRSGGELGKQGELHTPLSVP